MATFLDGVNRLLRINNIIRGDDDNITTFSDSQHASDISLAQIAIQDELAEIASERLISYEKTSSTIALVNGTRTYVLANDFVRFYGIASFYDSTQNVRIYEYLGGESALRDQDYQYATGTSTPVWWYWDDTTSKKVAFYAVPDANYDGRSLSYDYEKSVMVSDSTDTIPFHNTEEYYSFVSMASRRFRFMLTDQDLGLLTSDSTYNNAKARLYAFLKPTNAKGKYGRSYG